MSKRDGGKVSKTPESKPGGLSLAEFVRAKRREGCAVCRLPDELREQLRGASRRKIDKTTQREWLKNEHRIDVPIDAFNTHASGHHDER